MKLICLLVPTFSSINCIMELVTEGVSFVLEFKEKYPNILNSLEINAYQKLINDLERINFSGRISFSGFCEPLLTKNLNEYIKIVRGKLEKVQLEIVTKETLACNGKSRLKVLFDMGLNIVGKKSGHISRFFENLRKNYFIR